VPAGASGSFSTSTVTLTSAQITASRASVTRIVEFTLAAQ